MDKKMLLVIMNFLLALFIFIVNFLYFQKIPTLYSTINIICLVIAAFPIILAKYVEYSKRKELEDMFPVFLHDFTESVRGGMMVTDALKLVSKNDYKSLTPYVKRMAAQLDWGIPMEVVLLKFAQSVKSKTIAKIVSSVIETHRLGGRLTDTLEALGNIATQIDRLREERTAYLQSQIVTGYVVFFVFIGVIIGLERFLIPTLLHSQSLRSLSGTQVPVQTMAEEFRSIFIQLILIQGFFAGLTVGKMSEGVMVAGLKHSILMMLVGGIIHTIFA
jgi:flagellar protein FlaJ